MVAHIRRHYAHIGFYRLPDGGINRNLSTKICVMEIQPDNIFVARSRFGWGGRGRQVLTSASRAYSVARHG